MSVSYMSNVLHSRLAVSANSLQDHFLLSHNVHVGISFYVWQLTALYQLYQRSKSTHRFAEWQKNLTSQSVEIVRRSCKVTHKPVDLMQLLHLKVLIF